MRDAGQGVLHRPAPRALTLRRNENHSVLTVRAIRLRRQCAFENIDTVDPSAIDGLEDGRIRAHAVDDQNRRTLMGRRLLNLLKPPGSMLRR